MCECVCIHIYLFIDIYSWEHTNQKDVMKTSIYEIKFYFKVL